MKSSNVCLLPGVNKLLQGNDPVKKWLRGLIIFFAKLPASCWLRLRWSVSWQKVWWQSSMGSNFIRLHRNYHPVGLPPAGKVPEFWVPGFTFKTSQQQYWTWWERSTWKRSNKTFMLLWVTGICWFSGLSGLVGEISWMCDQCAAAAQGLCGHLQCFKAKCWAAWMNQHLSVWWCKSEPEDTELQTPVECRSLLTRQQGQIFQFLSWTSEVLRKSFVECATVLCERFTSINFVSREAWFAVFLSPASLASWSWIKKKKQTNKQTVKIDLEMTPYGE